LEVAILPEPDPAERDALLEAFATVAESEEPVAYRSAWRRAALDFDEDDDPFG
jgi:hypothetical protein